MRRNLMSCLPMRKRVQFFIYRLKHWREIKKLKIAIDSELIYGTGIEKPNGIIKAAEERTENAKGRET